MKHATNRQLMAIPIFTLLVTGLIACNQPWEPTREVLRSQEIQDVEPQTPTDEPGMQTEENTMEQWRPATDLGSLAEPTASGQKLVNTSANVNHVIFRVREPNEVTGGWIRMIPSSTNSRTLEPLFNNRNSSEPVAVTRNQVPIESVN
jgi:hypothetical protein